MTRTKTRLPRKKFISSFLIRERNEAISQNLTRANQERALVIRKLLQMGKEVVLSIRKEISPKERKLVESLRKVKGGKLRIISFAEDSIYSQTWIRDSFTKIGKKRILNSIKVEDLGIITSKESRLFGEGGRVINCGKINGEKILLISQSQLSTKYGFDKNTQRVIEDEIKMLRKRGYTVYSLPGGMFRPKPKNPHENFFHHLDVFVNHISGTNILLADSAYYSQNKIYFEKMKGLKVVLVPESERYFYPANFLNIGNKEVILEKRAKKTAELLRRRGIKVYMTPSSLKRNIENYGGIRCFVNELP